MAQSHQGSSSSCAKELPRKGYVYRQRKQLKKTSSAEFLCSCQASSVLLGEKSLQFLLREGNAAELLKELTL